MDNDSINSSKGARAPFVWERSWQPLGPDMSGGSPGAGVGDPLQTISQTIRTARTNANSLVLYAKKNPSVQRLVSNYEEWESNLRREAETRLGGFKPLQQLIDSNAEDWELLRRVKANEMPSSSGAWSTSMKRSVSEGSFLTQGSEAHPPVRAPRVHMRQDWVSVYRLHACSHASH